MTLINVTKRVQIEGKGWRFCSAVSGKNGKLKPDTVLIDGQEFVHPEGRYYLDFLQDGQRRRLAAGATAAEASAAADQQAKLLVAHNAATDAGVTLHLPQAQRANGRGLRDSVDAYLIEIKAHKKHKTWCAYKTALTYFLESCKKPTLEQITRADMLAFKTYLRDKKEQSDRSIANKFEIVMSFLKQQKVTGLVHKTDWPTYTQEEVETYTQDELDKFFAACTETETVYFEFFYRTAMRDQEVMNADWSWIDFERSVITIKENKRTGWTPKAYKGRFISIPSTLLALLKSWKSKQDKTNGLIFPTGRGNPKLDFCDECKAIAERAGLNPKDFYLHKFRATRATRLLQGGMDIKSVQQMLGHSDLESTMRYLGAQRIDVVQAKIEAIDAL